MFRQEGIAELTVGEIAQRLRCSRSRLYALAKTKDDLFLLIAKRYLGSLLLQSDEVIGAEGDVVQAINSYLDIGVRASALLGVPFLRDLEASGRGRRLFDAYQAKRGRGLASLVARGVADGVFNPRHAVLVAEILLGGALRIRRPRFLQRSGLSLEEAFAEFYALLLHGLLKQADGGALPVTRHWKAGEAAQADTSAPSAGGEADDVVDLLLRASVRH